MIDQANEIYILLSKHLKEELSDEERTQLNEWVNQSHANRTLFEEISNPDSLKKALLDYYKTAEEREAKESGEGEMGTVLNVYVTTSNRARYYMAAAVLLLVSVGLWLWLRPDNNKEIKTTGESQYGLTGDINPGRDGAVLTLANGQQIVLDTSANGVVALQGNKKIYKDGGKLIYDASETDKAHATSTLYNTLSTPRGRQYLLKLPDQSTIRLNAESSVKYPTQFAENERLIEITGEAYLEVAKDLERPFKVLVGRVKIEVTGTRFNVNAYKEETSLKATLIEGQIKVSNETAAVVLRAGNQVQALGDKLNVIDKADIDVDLAWINGLIAFKGTHIKEALQQVSRWYDIDVEYKTSVSVPNVTGVIPRSVKLSEVLKIMEINTGLHFSIIHNKVIVEQPDKK